jgi:hypothetical protein
MSKYLRFFAMIATSTIVMFCVKYLSTYETGHVFYSETRTYMALMMGAAMAIVMLSFMLPMYDNKWKNIGIYSGSVVFFIAMLWLVRSQVTVQDPSYMKSMIPHHSIAILTSERAEIIDVRVRELADGIIKAQRKEIKEMEWLLDDIAKNGKVATEAEAKQRPVPIFQGQR